MELQNPVLNGMNNAVQRDTNRNNNLFSALIAHAQHNNAVVLQDNAHLQKLRMIKIGVNPMTGNPYSQLQLASVQPVNTTHEAAYADAIRRGTASMALPIAPWEDESTRGKGGSKVPSKAPAASSFRPIVPPTPF